MVVKKSYFSLLFNHSITHSLTSLGRATAAQTKHKPDVCVFFQNVFYFKSLFAI